MSGSIIDDVAEFLFEDEAFGNSLEVSLSCGFQHHLVLVSLLVRVGGWVVAWPRESFAVS